MAYDRLTINGYSAEVLDDTGVTLYALREGEEVMRLDNPSRKQRKQFFVNAALEGADTITTWRCRYVRYMLRSVMTFASGRVVDQAIYKRRAGGDWFERDRERRQDVKSSI